MLGHALHRRPRDRAVALDEAGAPREALEECHLHLGTGARLGVLGDHLLDGEEAGARAHLACRVHVRVPAFGQLASREHLQVAKVDHLGSAHAGSRLPERREHGTGLRSGEPLLKSLTTRSPAHAAETLRSAPCSEPADLRHDGGSRGN